MKIIEALKELPLIEKRIQQKIQQISEYSSACVIGDRFHIAFETPDKQQKEVEALVQGVADLTTRHGKLRRVLSLTNAATVVTVGSWSKTISEWIDYREKGAKFQLQAMNALSDSAGRRALQKLNAEAQLGFSIHRFFDEGARNKTIDDTEILLSELDANLEMTNATTDLIEEI